jgi:hypothetical protein
MVLHGFDKLPTELLRLIFTKGIEDELDEYDPCSRRLKTFARIARNVCARWKALIDDPVDVSFWIARLRLEINALNFPNAEPFVKSLSRFRRQLLTSKGCDLAIGVCSPAVSTELDFGHAAPSGISLHPSMFRLMIHALDMLTPYQGQIVQMYWLGNQVDITVYLLELLVTRWKEAPRLVEIAFGQMPLPELPNLANIPCSDILPHRTAGWNRPLPITMAHLSNLTELKVPTMSWIEPAVLPPSLCHLEALYPEADSVRELYDFLTTQQHLRHHIRSISVGRMGISAEQEEVMLRSREQGHSSWKEWQNDDQLVLPALEILAFYKVPERQTIAFLGCLQCVSLQNAILHLSREVGSQRSQRWNLLEMDYLLTCASISPK